MQNEKRTELTPAERTVLDECRRESFFFRCVPLAGIALGAIEFLIYQGKIRKPTGARAISVRLSAVLAGYVAGKISYASACRAKLLKLENSPFADRLRNAQKSPSGMDVPGHPIYEERSSSKRVTDVRQLHRSDENPASSIDVDTHANQAKGLDDNFRPTDDSESGVNKKFQQRSAQQIDTEKVKTYADLRKGSLQNQQDQPSESGFTDIFQQRTTQEINTEKEGKTYADLRRGNLQNPQNPRVRRNAWGDIIEE